MRRALYRPGTWFQLSCDAPSDCDHMRVFISHSGLDSRQAAAADAAQARVKADRLRAQAEDLTNDADLP